MTPSPTATLPAALLLLACGLVTALPAVDWEQPVTSGSVARRVRIHDLSRPIKAVLLTNHNDPVLANVDVLYGTNNTALMELCARLNIVQMDWNGRPETDAAIRAEYNAIVDTLGIVANLTSHSELPFTGLFIQGLSGTAVGAGSIAALAPTRFGGVIKHHFSQYGVSSGLPCLYVVAGKDEPNISGFVHQVLTQQWPDVTGRAASGEPATLYLEPGNFHAVPASDSAFIAVWLEEIINLRFPATIPTSSMINLPSWKNNQAWVGSTDPSSDAASPWNGGARGINNAINTYANRGSRLYCWLPSQRAAVAWKQVMDTGATTTTTNTTVSLSAPANGATYAANAAITATATAAALNASGTITKVEFFDNGTLVGTDTTVGNGWSATWNLSATATHTLVAKATNSNGEVATSAAVDVLIARPADNPGTTVAGVNFAYYQNPAITGVLPDFGTLTPTSTGSATNFNISGTPVSSGYAFRFTGYVTIATAGTYTFSTNSDDGSQLFIGSDLVVDNGGVHGAIERSGSMALAAGQHAITVTFAQGSGGASLNVMWQGPGIAKTAIPDSALKRIAGSGDTTPPAQPAAPGTSSSTSSTPTLSGTTEPGATVRIYDNGALIATTTADATTGAWSITLSPALAAGVHNLTVVAVDAGNNASAPSGATVVTVPAGSTTPPVSASSDSTSGGCGLGAVSATMLLMLLGLGLRQRRV